MKVHVASKNIRLSDTQEEYLSKKMDSLRRHLGHNAELGDVRVELQKKPGSQDKDHKYQCDITVFLPHKVVLRAGEYSLSPEASLDLTISKLEQQIHKIHSKEVDKGKKVALKELTPIEPEELF
jgi:ribosomal subunit interface protein